MDEPLLEAHVLGVAQAAVGLEGRRVVGADVEHDLVARPQQLGGHGAGDRGRVAAAAVIDVGQDVADDREAGAWLTTWVPAAATSWPLTRMP